MHFTKSFIAEVLQPDVRIVVGDTHISDFKIILKSKNGLIVI